MISKKLKILAFTSIFTLTSLSSPIIGFSNSKTQNNSNNAPEIKIEKVKGNADNTKKIIVNLDFPEFSTSKTILNGEEYDVVEIPGCQLTGDIGKPALPSKVLMLEIPAGTKPTLKMVKKNEKNIQDLKIKPLQENRKDGNIDFDVETFNIDMETYNSNKTYPADNIIRYSVVKMRDHNVLIAEVSPIQINPSTKKAKFTSQLELTVDLAADADELAQALSESALSSSEYDTVMAQNFDNFNYTNPTTLPIYMILRDDQFVGNSSLDDFIFWKRKKGNNVVVVNSSQIPASVTGAPTVDELVSYMRNLPADQYPTYLLIIGNEDNANGIAGRYFSTDSGGYTDLDISCRTSTDWIPDLFCGRLPANNNSELNLMLNKVMSADRTPPSSSMYDKVLVAGQIQDSDNYDNVADRLFCETADSVAAYFEQDPGGIDYTATRAVVNPHSVTSTCLWNPSSILWNSTDTIGTRVFNTFVSQTEAVTRINNSINSGVAMVLHRDHGNSDGFGWSRPSYLSSNVSALTNGTNRPVVFSLNCMTGGYHAKECFAESWLLNPNGGASAVYAATDASYSWDNDWMTHGMMMGFLPNYRTSHNNSTAPNWSKDLPAPTLGDEGQSIRLGEILNYGKMYQAQQMGTNDRTHETFQLFHLFGDPEAFIQLHAPATQTVYHPQTIIKNANSQTITVETGEDNSLVCLYSPALNIHQLKSTTSGKADFTVSAQTTGEIYVTVTKYGKRPYEGVIDVEDGKLDLNASDVTKTSTTIQTDSSISNCIDGQTSTYTWTTGNLDDGKYRSYVQFEFNKPVTVSKFRALLGELGAPHITNEWALMGANSSADLNQSYSNLSSYIVASGTGANCSQWVEANLSSPVTKKVWKLYVHKTIWEDNPGWNKTLAIPEVELYGSYSFDLNSSNVTKTSTTVESGSTIDNSIDGQTNTYLWTTGNLDSGKYWSYVQFEFNNPVTVTKLKALIGEVGYPSITNEWALMASNNASDFNDSYSQLSSYIVASGQGANGNQWVDTSLTSPVAKKVWRLYVHKTIWEDNPDWNKTLAIPEIELYGY